MSLDFQMPQNEIAAAMTVVCLADAIRLMLERCARGPAILAAIERDVDQRLNAVAEKNGGLRDAVAGVEIAPKIVQDRIDHARRIRDCDKRL